MLASFPEDALPALAVPLGYMEDLIRLNNKIGGKRSRANRRALLACLMLNPGFSSARPFTPAASRVNSPGSARKDFNY